MYEITLRFEPEEGQLPPHMWNWQEVMDHPTPVEIVSCRQVVDLNTAGERSEASPDA